MKKFLPLLILVLLIVTGVSFGFSQSEYLQGKYTSTAPAMKTQDGDGTNDTDIRREEDVEEKEDYTKTTSSTSTTEIREKETIDVTYTKGSVAEAVRTTDLSDLTNNDGATAEELLYSHCYDNINEYTGDDTDVETAYQSTFEACINMLAAEEAMESAESALTSTKEAANNNDKESADAAAEVTQEYADAAAGYAEDARNAADKADTAADKISDTHLDLDTTAIEPEDLSTIETIEPNQSAVETNYSNEYNWLDDLNTWEPDITVEPDYINDAEQYFENTLSSADLQEFQKEDAYYAFLVTVYAEAMETNPSLGEDAVTDAYESNTLGLSQYQTYSTVNSAMTQTLQDNFRY